MPSDHASSEHLSSDRLLSDRLLSNHRLILYHKHGSSGRTLFLRLQETVCQFGGISSAARIVERQVGGIQVTDDCADLCADLLTKAEQQLGLPDGSLAIDREFKVAIEDADTPIVIYLAQFTAIEPPQAQLAEHAGKFIALTEARRLPPTELELLVLAYSTIMDDLSGSAR